MISTCAELSGKWRVLVAVVWLAIDPADGSEWNSHDEMIFDAGM